MRTVFSLLLSFGLLFVLTACSAPLTPDQAELSNFDEDHLIPKSRPKQLVNAFDTYCVNGPASLKNADAQLRAAEYVPLPVRERGITAYVRDDRRPAVARSDRMCMVQAAARSGQNDRFLRYMKDFRNAQPISPAPLGRNIQQAWRVDTPAPAIIATQRKNDLGKQVFALILFREAS